MPSYLIVGSSQSKLGVPIDGLLCEFPNRGNEVPVKATIHSSERSLRIDDEPCARRIISCQGRDGTTTYLVAGSSKSLRNAERRAVLNKATAQLQQLAASLRPLRAASEEPELATEGLGLLFNWIAEERERLVQKDSAIRIERESML